MAQQLEAKVIRVVEAPIIDLTGQVTERVQVQYVVGSFGPFSVTIPKPEFTAARVKQEMDKMVAQLSALPAR